MNVQLGGKYRGRGRKNPRFGGISKNDRKHTGSLGASSIFSVHALKNRSQPIASVTPRYSFDQSNALASCSDVIHSSMGPPTGPIKNFRKQMTTPSTSTKPGTSSGAALSEQFLPPRNLSKSLHSTSRDFSTPQQRQASNLVSSSSCVSGNRTCVVPPSARSTTTITSVVQPCVIIAISEGRGQARGEIGLAAVNLRHPHLVLCQFSDTLSYIHTLTKINYFNPVEIIVPHTFCEGIQPSALYQLIRDQFPSVNLTTVQRRHFSEAAGVAQLQHLCAPEYSAVQLLVLHKFYALTAAAAVLKYVEFVQCIVFATESLKIEYHCSEDSVLIDVDTAMRLELVQPLDNALGSCSLLGVLGPTATAGGTRLLRASILQPSCKKEVIEARLDSVQELIDSADGLMVELQNIIKKLCDVDKILWLCVESSNSNTIKTCETQLNQTIILKVTMELVPALVRALTIAEGGKFREIRKDLENSHYAEIYERIKEVIQDDAHLEKGVNGNLQRCFAVKPDINGLLDVARRTYSELIDDIQNNVTELGKNYDLPLRLHQNTARGFHILMPLTKPQRNMFKKDDLPTIFIQVQNSGRAITMTTEELILLDQQAKESLNEIQSMSNIVIYGLLKELRPFMGSLYKLCEHVAELDVLLALAQVSSVGSYVRPDFNDYLELKQCVHPLLDYTTQVSPVPNDVFASPEYNFHIITGPNMGGKSVYIKQIALMHVMAQIGCFVPAAQAVIRITDHIFSRIGFEDSIEYNASTYVLEMKEIKYILQAITPTSLVIVDELCRGTSCEEGASMAWAVCEELLQKTAFTFFTTHFMYLTRLEELYFNVVNLHTLASEDIVPGTDNEKRLTYLHQIAPGVTDIDHYGLTLAKNTNLPAAITQLAQELAKIIEKKQKPLPIASDQRVTDKKLYKLHAELKHASRNINVTNEILDAILNKFKLDNPVVMEELGDTRNINEKVISKNTSGHSKNSLEQSVMPRESDSYDVIKESSDSPRSSSTRDKRAKLSDSLNDNLSGNTSTIQVSQSSGLLKRKSISQNTTFGRNPHDITSESIDISQFSNDFNEPFDMSDLCTQKLNSDSEIDSSDNDLDSVLDISSVSMQSFINELNNEIQGIIPPPSEFA